MDRTFAIAMTLTAACIGLGFVIMLALRPDPNQVVPSNPVVVTPTEPREPAGKPTLTTSPPRVRARASDYTIARYMVERWEMYERRDGVHDPDRHDPLVLQDAAMRFNITQQQALEAWRRAPASVLDD